MKPLFTSVLLALFIVFGNLAVAQGAYNQLVEDVKRVCDDPHADKAEVARLNRQIKQIYADDADSEVIEALKVFHVASLSELIDSIADQIDEQMLKGQFARIGVPEFTTGTGRTFDPAYGALPRYITESLRHALAKKSQRHRNYSVLSEEALLNTLKVQGISPADLRTEKAKNLHNQADGEDVSILVDGNLNRAGEGGMKLKVTLIDTSKGSLLERQIGGTALLNSQELAMSGISQLRLSPELPGYAKKYRLEPGVGLVSERQWEKFNRPGVPLSRHIR